MVTSRVLRQAQYNTSVTLKVTYIMLLVEASLKKFFNMQCR